MHGREAPEGERKVKGWHVVLVREDARAMKGRQCLEVTEQRKFTGTIVKSR